MTKEEQAYIDYVKNVVAWKLLSDLQTRTPKQAARMAELDRQLEAYEIEHPNGDLA